jgi:hypothetical protein
MEYWDQDVDRASLWLAEVKKYEEGGMASALFAF